MRHQRGSSDIKSDLAIDELRRVLPLLSGLVTGNAKPDDRDSLESILKTLRHWRRVKTIMDSDHESHPASSESLIPHL
jgi:hypothetical protein